METSEFPGRFGSEVGDCSFQFDGAVEIAAPTSVLALDEGAQLPELRFFDTSWLGGARALVQYGAWSAGVDLLRSRVSVPAGAVTTLLVHGTFAYSFQLLRPSRRSAFAKPYVWWVKDSLSFEAMTTAASHFNGMHDFRSFSDDDPDEKSTDVLVEDVTVAEAGDLVLVRVAGSHFIWKMVRRMVGVLVEVGTGRLEASDVPALLTRDSALPARVTAPASGLLFIGPRYPRQWGLPQEVCGDDPPA